jgi:DNA (cytosine-5)-methyltransferase 1
MSLGLRAAGLTPVAAYDASAPALEVYRRNIGPHAWRADLARPAWVIRMLDALKPDLIAAGPPCQDFSSAGKRIEGARAALMLPFGDVVAAVRPIWFLLENVPEARESRAYFGLQSVLRGIGYGLTELVLDASLCGVPQWRERFICIGRLGAPDDFLKRALLDGLSPTPMTMREYFGDALGIEHFYRHPRSYGRRAVYSIDEPAPTVRTTHREPAPGYKRHKMDSADPREVRALTPQELARVQTFPNRWQWRGSRMQIVRMIGNAVPPAFAAYLGRAILAYDGAVTTACESRVKINR